MTISHKHSSIRVRAWLAVVLPLATIGLVGSLAPAMASSSNPAFQRHFWRGQNNHGDINFDRPGAARSMEGLASAEALVEDGTRGAAIARRAAACANRFTTYDPATGMYLGYDGRPRACR